MMMKTKYPNKKLTILQPEFRYESTPKNILNDIAVWSQLRPSHSEHPVRNQNVCADSIANNLGHASGRLPKDREDFCKAWHWPGDSIDERESAEHIIEGVVHRSYTWARLAAKARTICHPINRGSMQEVEV